LLEHINEATAAIRNETEMHENIGCSMEQHVPACIQAKDHFENSI
jgi:hypothetical protein